MKAVTIALACVAVFFLAVGVMISAPAAAPAASLDRCLACHPQAHPNGWEQRIHYVDIEDGTVPMTECERCHTAQYCVDCHAREQASGSGSGPAQPSATQP